MRLQLLFSTADIVSWTSPEMGSDSKLNTPWCQCHILMPFCHTLYLPGIQLPNVHDNSKTTDFQQAMVWFISLRTAISTTFPIQFYLTLVKIEMPPSDWLSFLVDKGKASPEDSSTHLPQIHKAEDVVGSLGGFCLWMGYRESWKTPSQQVFPILAHDIYPGHITPPLFSTWIWIIRDDIYKAASPCSPPTHVPKCHTHVLLELFQGQWLPLTWAAWSRPWTTFQWRHFHQYPT